MRLSSLFALLYLSFGTLAGWAQAGPPTALIRVSRTVSDADTRQALAGVAVRLQHARQGVITNNQGVFTRCEQLIVLTS